MSKSYFNDVSRDWDLMRKSFFPDRVRESAITAAGILPGYVVADIGAGTGFITESLVHLPVSVIAVDQSPGMIRTMKEKFLNFTKIEYIQGYSDWIPLPDKKVDVALANMYLHHVYDPKFVINELYRILKPGGRLVITDLDLHNHEFLVTEQHDRWKGFDREDIRNWYLKAGFGNITVTCLGHTCQSESKYKNVKADISIFIAVGEK